jgi:hypothetical protein
MYEVKDPFWQIVDHWQTLIAGLLALVAAGGTVWGTLAVAKRQVKAANEAADRQIKAATAAADRQVPLRKSKPTPRSAKPRSRAKSNAAELHEKDTPFTRC